jgi:histidinol-phosphatase (PHP family)
LREAALAHISNSIGIETMAGYGRKLYRRRLPTLYSAMGTAAPDFIWETHGIHTGTIVGPIKHGIDDIDGAIERSIELGHPAVTFIIHTPRLTTFRYEAEERLGLKFIRGDSAFADYVALMKGYKRRYADRIEVHYGIELEWQGLGLGLTWSRAKIEQMLGVDFIVGSVHFSAERIPYDGSKEEAERLLRLRGSPEAYWEGYLDEVLTMLDAWGEYIHAVGHLDLPKLHVPAPEDVREPMRGSGPLARKLRTILWKLSDKGIALDVNLSGDAKGCGIYPSEGILMLTREIGVSICVGTDCHALADIGRLYSRGVAYLEGLGFSRYLSFSRGRPQVHILGRDEAPERADFESVLNTGYSLIAQLDNPSRRKVDYQAISISLGEKYGGFREALGSHVPAGEGASILLRKDGHSLLIGREAPESPDFFSGIYFKHRDRPGTLALLVSVLASEGVNIDSAYLFNKGDGFGEAYISVSGCSQERVENACEFALGTNAESFLELIPDYAGSIPSPKASSFYIHAIDDVELAMPPAAQMVHSVHEDRPGMLFVLLAALAARDVNVFDLRLTQSPGIGHALLAVRGESLAIQLALASIRPEFRHISYLSLGEERGEWAR